jgi:hypothetical protein
MDVCTESCCAVWLALVRATGLLRGDADTRALLEDNIDRCIHDVEAREEALGKQMRTVLADAKLALRRGQRVQARACASRGQRYAAQLQKLRSMLDTLHAHKDMVDTTQLNMSIVGALKQTSLALTSWKKDGVVRDVSEVDQIRQELEVRLWPCAAPPTRAALTTRRRRRTTCARRTSS